MLRKITLMLLVACAVPSFASPTPTPTPATTPSTDLAKNSASTWLALIDAKDVRLSWDQASIGFKAAVTSAQWSQALNGARGPLGTLRQRDLKSEQFTTTLPGAPDGQYVVLQYQSAFQSKANAIETVIVALDSDGVWRVAGYFIR